MLPKWNFTRGCRSRCATVKIDWEVVLALAVLSALIALAVLVFFVGISNAETCLTLDVQPNQVLGNYDGDTFTISLGALGHAIVRVEGVDTPERNKKQAGWKEAKEFTAQWLAAGPFQLNTCLVLTLGRIVGNPSRDGITLASALLAAGHVKPH